MSRRSYTWNAYESSLNATALASATTIDVVNTDDLSAPGYLVIDPDITNPQLREWIYFTNINGTLLEGCTRGLPGSVGPIGVGSTHESGALIRAIFTKQNLDDIFLDIQQNTIDLLGDINATPPAGGHIPDADDPHSAAGYIKQTDATAQFVNVTGDTMTGPLLMGQTSVATNPIENLSAPVNDTDAATKLYVDDNEFSGDHADLTNVTTAQHHPRYDDAEAVGAMGATNDNNTLNHDRYTDADALAATDSTYLKLTGGTVTGTAIFQGELTSEVALNIGATSGQFLRMLEFTPGVFQMYVSNGANNGTRYGLQIYASGNDFLDVSHDGHVFTIGEVNDTDVMFRNITNDVSTPTAPVKGTYWVDTTAKALKVWNGSSWVIILQGV